MISDFIDNFCIDHDLTESNQIGDEGSNLFCTVKNREFSLLFVGNILMAERHSQSVLIRFFMVSMTHFIQHIQRTADDLIYLFLEENLFVLIRVYSWFNSIFSIPER